MTALILNLQSDSSEKSGDIGSAANYQIGILYVSVASMLSGLSTALTQKALVSSKPRHALFFSAELAVYGIIFLVAQDSYLNIRNARDPVKGVIDLFNISVWSWQSFVPVLTNVREYHF